MEVKSTRYTVEYYSRTIWDEYFSDRRSFNTEPEALAYIQELLKNPALVRCITLLPKKLVLKRSE